MIRHLRFIVSAIFFVLLFFDVMISNFSSRIFGMSVFFLGDLMIDVFLIPILLSSSNICRIFSYLFAFFLSLMHLLIFLLTSFKRLSYLLMFPFFDGSFYFFVFFHIVVHSCRVVIPLKSLPFHLVLLLRADSMVYSTSSSPFPLRLLASFASLLLPHCTSGVVLSYVFVVAAADASVAVWLQ